jgi:ABC-type nitrate/sulfonate/bicarbonate transport system substrate-binding protein
MQLVVIVLVFSLITGAANVWAEPVRAAYPSANVQFLPAFVALEKGFYKREGLDAELISVRNAVTAVQALLGNQIDFIFSVGPQMPSIWEGSDIILLAQQVGRPTFSMMVTPDIQRITDLKGKKIGVSFGGSTFAGTKALLELNKMNPDKDVQYVSIPGSAPKVAAMQQGIIQAALLAPPADYIALKAGFKRLVNLADVSRTPLLRVSPPREKPSKSNLSSLSEWYAPSCGACIIPATIRKMRCKSRSNTCAWNERRRWTLIN